MLKHSNAIKVGKNCGYQALYFTGSTDFFFFFFAGDVELATSTGSAVVETGLSVVTAVEDGGWLLVSSLASLTSMASCTRTLLRSRINKRGKKHIYFEQGCGYGSAVLVRIGKLDPDPDRSEIKIKINKFQRLKMEHWRVVGAHKWRHGGYKWSPGGFGITIPNQDTFLEK
jgi:hypothetical protein